MREAKPGDVLIEIEGLRFTRGNRVIFEDVDLVIRRGTITGIMGPSGTGKTTLLRLIGGQLRPEAGRIRFEGEDVHRLSRAGLYRVRRQMGLLFQSGALFTDLTCFDNVAFPLREHTNLPERLVRLVTLMKLQAVGLRGARDLYPAELSGGMARRVALARAIALDPAVVMYDEPFSGQDPISMGTLVQLIHVLNEALQLTSIIVSHDVPETLRIADEVYVLSEGRVVEHGSPASLRESRSEWVQQFLQALPDGPVPFHYPAPDYALDLLGEGAVEDA